MGEYFQTIVDIEVSAADARQTANRLVAWLIELEVIEPDLSPCILDIDGLGYAPLKYELVTQLTPGESSLHRLANRGLEVQTGRQVGYTWTHKVEVSCPVCTTRFAGDWTRAVGEWYENRGPAELKCEACGSLNSVVHWSFDPVWGFGNLAFTFWNWPRLKPSFVADIQRQLDHKIVLVSDKI